MAETVTKQADFICLKNNKVIGSLDMIESKIVFCGTGNLVFVNSDSSKSTIAQLYRSEIIFYGNNNLVFLNAGKAKYVVDLQLFHNSICHIGANNYFNPYGEILRLRCYEEKNIFIGNDGLFSSGVEVLTSDSHLIFDSDNYKRINYGKSVYIGDHVWIGRLTAILKGCQIGSGAIIGTRSVVSGKKIPSNTSWGGGACKKIR